MFQHSETESVSAKEKHSARYTRIPKEVLLDLGLSSDAVRVYAYLALWVFQGNAARIGMRRIGKELGISAATVYRRLQELIAGGHVSAGAVERGSRAWYVLNSSVFAAKQRAGVEEVICQPRPRLASVRTA